MDIGHNSPEQRVRNINRGRSEKYYHQYQVICLDDENLKEAPDKFDLIMVQGRCGWESARILIEGRAHNGYQEPH